MHEICLHDNIAYIETIKVRNLKFDVLQWKSMCVNE